MHLSLAGAISQAVALALTLYPFSSLSLFNPCTSTVRTKLLEESREGRVVRGSVMGASVEGGHTGKWPDSDGKGRSPYCSFPPARPWLRLLRPLHIPMCTGCTSWPLQMLLPRVDSASVGSTSAAWRSFVCHQLLPQGALCIHLLVEVRRYRNTRLSADEGEGKGGTRWLCR